MFQQYPMSTLVARGPKRGKEQLNRIRRTLKNNQIEFYKTAAQTEQTRGVPGQTDQLLLTKTINNQTLKALETQLRNTTLKLETWPYMPP